MIAINTARTKSEDWLKIKTNNNKRILGTETVHNCITRQLAHVTQNWKLARAAAS